MVRQDLKKTLTNIKNVEVLTHFSANFDSKDKMYSFVVVVFEPGVVAVV